ncbi:hypothetical protein OF83DRAFT_1296094, partial [Amylostereum chailletii]
MEWTSGGELFLALKAIDTAPICAFVSIPGRRTKTAGLCRTYYGSDNTPELRPPLPDSLPRLPGFLRCRRVLGYRSHSDLLLKRPRISVPLEEHTTPTFEPQTPPHDSPSVPKPKPKFQPLNSSSHPFAVIIALDNYSDHRVDELYGAVRDARDVKKFLTKNLNVPTSRIQELYDDKATRRNIKGCIRGLETHPDIKKDNPILIFYAGHGSEAVPPRGWPAGGPNKKIQMLVPYDFIPSTVHSERGQGIPDITLSVLLIRIAKAKGDNIVSNTFSLLSFRLSLVMHGLILDCCYSGSGTRMNTYDSTLKVHGVSLPRNY